MKLIRMVFFLPLTLIRLILVLLVSAFIVAVGLIVLKFYGFSRNFQKTILQVWGKTMMAICGISVTNNHVPNRQHFILMANHRSYLDVVVLAAFLPASYVAKAEVLSWPLMKTASRLTNIIFVARTELKSTVLALNKIKASVSSGVPVAVFPEGTTCRGPLTRPFKKGSFKIAVDLKIPVIPAALHYEDEDDAWIDEDTFIGHFFRQMGKPVTRVHLQFGNEVTCSDANTLRERVKEEIDSMLSEIIARISGKK